MEKTFDNRTITNSNFTIISVLIFLFFCGLLLVNHEMWRDELQAWLIAKDSSSLLNLFDNLHHEAHPYLWYIMLYVLSRFTEQPFVMQVFHLFLATSVIYIFVKYSPFTRLQKIFFIFGYFPLYEYGVISRNYSLGFFLILAFCAMFQASRNRNLLVLSVILVIISQINAHALMIATTMGFMLAFECVIDKDIREKILKRKWIILVSIFIFVFGIIVSVLQQILPPDASSNTTSWRFGFDLKGIAKAIAIICKSYLPIPKIRLHFWGSNIIGKTILQLILSSILFCYFLLLFARKPVILFLYSIGTLGFVVVSYTKYYGYIRHHGNLFILLVMCLWLSAYYPDRKIRLQFINNLSVFCSKYKGRVITFILAAQLIAGVFAGGVDLLYSFSGGKEAAKFIEDNQMQNMLLIGDDESITTVAGYLNKKIYYMQSGRFGSFVVWDKKMVAVRAEKQKITSQEILTIAEDLMTQYKKDVLVILNYQPPDISNSEPHKSGYSLKMIKEFTGNIEPDEQFYLYTIKYDRLNTTG